VSAGGEEGGTSDPGGSRGAPGGHASDQPRDARDARDGRDARDARGAAPASAPAVSVVVPTHERRALLLRVLSALDAQTLAKDGYEVVVVCDGCTDGTADAVCGWASSRAGTGRTFASNAIPGAPANTVEPSSAVAPGALALTVLEQPGAGAAAARNRGARAAAAPLLLFLDDDMIADPGLLEAHLDRHVRAPGAVVIGAVPVDPSSPRSYLSAGLAAWADRRDARLSSPGTAVPPEDVLTGQLSIARAAFEALGGFDPRFTAGGAYGGEDVDLGWRARRANIPIVYEPRAISRQIYDKSFGDLRRDVRHAGASDVRMVRLHPEIAPSLMLGRAGSLPGWQGRVLRLTLARPALASALLAPVLWVLDLAARRHGVGKLLEDLHAIARAHLYALGMKDAGWRDPGA
jgi:GT2 family glycosyltransferase